MWSEIDSVVLKHSSHPIPCAEQREAGCRVGPGLDHSEQARAWVCVSPPHFAATSLPGSRAGPCFQSDSVQTWDFSLEMSPSFPGSPPPCPTPGAQGTPEGASLPLSLSLTCTWNPEVAGAGAPYMPRATQALSRRRGLDPSLSAPGSGPPCCPGLDGWAAEVTTEMLLS